MHMFQIYKHFAVVNGHQTARRITNKILSKTKGLTLSSKKYHNYLENFSEGSKEKLYEQKTEYNLLPSINSKKPKNYKAFYKPRKTATTKISKNILTEFNINNNIGKQRKNNRRNLSNRTLQNRNANFFICDYDYVKTDYVKTKLIKNKNIFNKGYKFVTQNNFKNLHKKLKAPYSTGKNKAKDIDQNNERMSTTAGKERNSEKQIFCLLDSIFSENKKNDKLIDEINYEERDIFGYKSSYLNYLRKELTSLTKDEKEINLTSKFTHNYNNKIYGKIIMELNSAKIEITNKINNKICCEIDIPFSMISLFYLSTVKQIPYIILNLFKSDVLIKNEESNIMEALKDIVTNQITYKNNVLLFKNKFEDEGKNYILSDYMNYRNLKYRTSVRYNLLTLNLKSEALNQIIFENCTFNSNNSSSVFSLNYNYNVTKYNENIEAIKCLFDSNINLINMPWITLDSNYNIKITMPKIAIKLPNYSKQINHFIDKQLLVFLYKNNFKDWNFYISHYLFTLKKFRICINNILSYYTLFNLGINRIKFNKFKISEPETENNKNYIFTNKDENNETKSDEYKNIIYEKHYLSNLRFEQYNNSLNDSEYIFLVSDDENIQLYKLRSYVLYAYNCSDLKHPKIYYFDFSFYQMKILFYKSKYENLGKFFQRLIKINKDKKKIYFDYYYFTTFKSMNLEQIKQYFEDTNFIENLNNINIDPLCSNNNINVNISSTSNKISVNNNNENNPEQITLNDLILKVMNPKFISVSIKKIKNENNVVLKEIWEKNDREIGDELIENLVQNDIKNWGTILWQNKDHIEAFKIGKNDSKKKARKFKGKKDFKEVFKKFLKIK